MKVDIIVYDRDKRSNDRKILMSDTLEVERFHLSLGNDKRMYWLVTKDCNCVKFDYKRVDIFTRKETEK